MTEHVVERLMLPPRETDLRALGELLVDAVDSGAAVSFLAPLTPELATRWWRQSLATHDSSSGTRAPIVLVAREPTQEVPDRPATPGGIVGTVQLQPAWAPNQPHRAEVCKLIVHRRSRRAGLGRRLMLEVENAARDAGFRLLTLDAKRDGDAEHLYRRLGWIHAGTIPRFALDCDARTPHDAVIYYKHLD